MEIKHMPSVHSLGEALVLACGGLAAVAGAAMTVHLLGRAVVLAVSWIG